MLQTHIIVLFCCIHSVCSQAAPLSFKGATLFTPMNPEDYNRSLDSNNPLGFTEAILPHPANDDRPNPAIYLEKLTGKYIDFRIETVNRGDSICAKDNDNGPAMCDQGTVRQCYAPSLDKLMFEFYCADSCVSSDVLFFYRVVVSPEGADDQWCFRQTDEFPSYLRLGPDTLPKERKTTPPLPSKHLGNMSVGVIPAMVLIFAGILTSLYSMY